LFNINPESIKHDKYKELREENKYLDTDVEKSRSDKRVELAIRNNERYFSLDKILVNYIDLKYNEIWS